jgi:hypothetical protein
LNWGINYDSVEVIFIIYKLKLNYYYEYNKKLKAFWEDLCKKKPDIFGKVI